MELLAGDMISACIYDPPDSGLDGRKLDVVGRNAGPDLTILLTKAILCISRWCNPRQVDNPLYRPFTTIKKYSTIPVMCGPTGVCSMTFQLLKNIQVSFHSDVHVDNHYNYTDIH